MSLLFSLLMKMDAGQAKTELRALQTEMTKAGGTAKVLGDGVSFAGEAADAMAAEIAALKAQIDALIAAQSKGKTTTDQFQRSTQGAASSVGNLTAQFNDIGMMIMAGQNPLQLAIQQGTQITQVIGPMGASGAVKALGGALISMLSPINLVTLGVIGGGAAMIQWLTSAQDEAMSLEDAMGKLSKSMEAYQKFADLSATSTAELARRFGDFAGQVKGFSEYMKGVSLGTVLTDMDAAIGPLKGNLSAVVVALQQVQAAKDNVAKTQLAVDQGLENPMALANAKDALDLFQAKAEEAAASMGLLPDQAVALSDALNNLGAADGMIEIRDRAAEAFAMIQSFESSGTGLSTEVATVASFLNEIVNQSAEAANAGYSLADALRSGQAAADSLAGAASGLASFFTSADGAAAGLANTLARAAANAWSMAQGRLQAQNYVDNAGMIGQYQLYGASRRAAPDEPVVPKGAKGGAGSGGGAAKAEADAVAELITKLREEQEVLRESDPVKQELLKYRKQLADATAAERAEVEALIRAEQQLKAIQEAEDWASKSAADFLDAIIVKGESAEDALKSLLSSLIKVGIQALMLGEGPLAGILGIKGGLFSGLFGGLGAKALASGGDAAPARLAGRKAIRAGDVAGFADAARRRPIRGLITGDGGPRDDRVPAWLSPGEYIVNGQATARYRPVLERMNAGADIAGYASGGMVGAARGAGIGGAGGRGRPPVGDIHIHGAQGDAQIREMVAQGIKVGLTAYDRDVLPTRVPGILRDPRAR